MKKRVVFVDVLRLIALAQMVNGHTLHAVLTANVRQGEFYQGYLWFRGLVSVAFMLVAGLAFQITTLARFERHKADAEARRRRVLRALEIIAIGFLLRFPLASLVTLDIAALERGLSNLTRIDVLPCIGVSLLVLEGLVAVFRKPVHVVAACALLALLCASLAPWGATLPVDGALGFVTGWLGPQGGSQFPLFPYAGYVFAGAVIGFIVFPESGAAPAPRLLFFGAALLGTGFVAHLFVAQRLGAVTLAVGVLAYALRNVTELPRVLRVLSGETLALYVFHLLVLYAQPIALHSRLGETLGLGPALGWSAFMLFATTCFGLTWNRLKTWRPAQKALPSERAIVLTFAGALSLTLALLATRAAAAPPVNTNGTAYAIGGYDPVAYFEQSAAVRGKAEHSAQYAGATWLFADAAHRSAFQKDPAHYAPAYAGHCAYAAAQKRLVNVDPNAWSIVQGRLYLNYSLDIRRKWDSERERFIRAADAFWSTLTGPRAELRSISLTVADLDAAESFFVGVLGFGREGTRSVLHGPEYEGLVGVPGARATHVQLALGREHIELVDYDAPAGRTVPVDSRSDDLWFQHLALVAGDIDLLHAKLQSLAVRPISDAVQTIPSTNVAAGGIRAFYFRGPAAHPLELIWYPRDKGMARWHSTHPGLLGIDHTAIAVSNSERARTFYEESLGLAASGQSFNSGSEQERLSAVPGARVKITGLRGPQGPGVELLEYEAPSGGRPAPGDTRASDLWYTEITVAVSDLDNTVAKLRAAGARFVSDHIRDTRTLVPGTQRGVVVRDPDGHAVRIVQ